MINKTKLPYRQIHLDFHTSPLLENVASQFDAEEYISLLKSAHVNSITSFARCHHGLLYYPSKLFPERIHPNLTNHHLLLDQIEACHKNGIKAPIYITVQWDHYSSTHHPEWLCKDENDVPLQPLYNPGFYQFLCVNTEYRNFLKAHVKEISEMVPKIDGFFFDILWHKPCACPSCQDKMKTQGFDWMNPDDRATFARLTIDDFTKDMTEFVHKLVPGCSIYYNDGDVQPDHKKHLPHFTHLEFDALPSGHGNYQHFPITTRTNRAYGLDYAGHTGIFHTGWGDLHSYKNLKALEYECFMLLALGGKCIIGDQLHPSGKLDPVSYERIGAVYSQIEAKEQWCEDSLPVSEIGLYVSQQSAMIGAHRILKESGYQYDIIDHDTDFSQYKVILLPDQVMITPQLENLLLEYLNKGGRILASFLSGTDAQSGEFLVPFGIEQSKDLTKDTSGNIIRGTFYDRNEYADYLIPSGVLGKNLPKVPHIMYAPANQVSLTKNGHVISQVIQPPFQRTGAGFSSHQQAPCITEHGDPAAVGTDNTLYLAHNVFEIYKEYAPSWCKTYVQNALDYLLKKRILTHNGSSTLEVIVTHQPVKNRYVIHLLHYVPLRRASKLEIIEDSYPLHNLSLTLSLPHIIKDVRIQPTNAPLEYTFMDNLEATKTPKSSRNLNFTLPYMDGHQLIELSY